MRLILAALLLAPATASAHAMLQAAIPPVGGSVAACPTRPMTSPFDIDGGLASTGRAAAINLSTSC